MGRWCRHFAPCYIYHSDNRLPCLTELDCGPYANDPEKALQFKEETDAVLVYTLGKQPFSGIRPPMAPVMSAFSGIAEKVVARITAGTTVLSLVFATGRPEACANVRSFV